MACVLAACMLPTHVLLLCDPSGLAALLLCFEYKSAGITPITLQSLPPEVREAKFVGLAALRAEMYDRNLQVRLG